MNIVRFVCFIYFFYKNAKKLFLNLVNNTSVIIKKFLDCMVKAIENSVKTPVRTYVLPSFGESGDLIIVKLYIFRTLLVYMDN